MNATENKRIIEEIFNAMAEGDLTPFGEHLATDVRWTIAGRSEWSRTFDGAEAVRRDLLQPLFANFADQYKCTPARFVAEDETVVVEARGAVTLHSGEPYHNEYCFVFRLADGKIKEITEYCDTDLIARVLARRERAPKASAAESAAAILKLYELRRDPEMRAARQWFLSEFAPQSAMDIVGLFRDGERASANFRMVSSYWDTAASLVLNGAIDRKTFLDANTEHIYIYAVIEPFLADIRQIFREDDFLLNLEKLVLSIPGVEAKIEGRRRLAALWARGNKEEAAAN